MIHYGMYVRWQTYRSQARSKWLAESNDRWARLKAVLVESVRVDGKPRQKHIAFLGSVQADDPRMIEGEGANAQFWRRMSTRRKVRFWRDVMRRLERLGNRISPAARERISAAILLSGWGVGRRQPPSLGNSMASLKRFWGSWGRCAGPSPRPEAAP